jgi:hypothetical protein
MFALLRFPVKHFILAGLIIYQMDLTKKVKISKEVFQIY